jgi:hypothetical protein
MPYFTTIEGTFTLLCVFAAMEQPCPNPKCDLSHEPKERRVCPMYHNPREKCPHEQCLLGHQEARDALRQLKAFKRCKRLAKDQEGNDADVAESKAGEEANQVLPGTETNQVSNPKPVPEKNANLNPNPDAPTNPVLQPAAAEGNQQNHPVSFQRLAQDLGQKDEFKRLY